MYSQIDKQKENKSRTVANSVTKKKSNVKQGVEFVDNRPEQLLQRKLQSSASQIVQLRPQKREDSDEYFDPDFPDLRLIKTNRKGAGNEYRIVDTERCIYYEEGEGWFDDYDCTQKVNMSAYQGDPNDREGIDNYEGKTYYYYTQKHTGDFLPVMVASGLANKLNQEKGQEYDEGKIKRIVSEMNENTPIHPIEIRRKGEGWELVNGRHRVAASALAGKTRVPYNEV